MNRVASVAAPGACWVANDNAPGQVVIAGTAEGLELASTRARDLGVKRVTPLNVGAAFHTPLMADATTALRDELRAVEFSRPAAPVVSNHDALPYERLEAAADRLVQLAKERHVHLVG